MDMSASDINKFMVAIRQRYSYELLVDNLPMRLFVGELATTSVYLYTHIDFVVSVNNGNIVQSAAAPGMPVQLVKDEPMKVGFTYSVSWKTVSASASCDFVGTLTTLSCIDKKVSRARYACERRRFHTRVVQKCIGIQTISVTAISIGLALETRRSASSC